jgi:hypothetical protein
MLTDAPPRKNRSSFFESDRIKTLDLPRKGELTKIAQRLESAMKSDNIRDVRSACTEFLLTASNLPVTSAYSPQDLYAPASMGHSNFLATIPPNPC